MTAVTMTNFCAAPLRWLNQVFRSLLCWRSVTRAHYVASQFVALGVFCFACTPDQFPDLMATAIKREDVNRWAAAQDIVTAQTDG
jgi:hypothetical protein